MIDAEIQYHDAIRKNYLYDLNRNINQSIKNKAMLSLKYDDLNFWITLVQVSIIFISTGLTVMNSIKSYYGVKSQVIDVISIIMTALIGLIMAIYRFYKMDERKEALCNLRDNYTAIINKFNKVLHKMDKYVITHDNTDDWNQLITTYQDEIIDTYLGIKENFETIFDYQDIIYYKNKFKKMYLEHELVNNEIETVHYFKKTPVSKYKSTEAGETTSLCNRTNKTGHIQFDQFINNYENQYLEEYQHHESSKKRNQDLYHEYMINNDSDLLNSADSSNLNLSEVGLPISKLDNESEKPNNINMDTKNLNSQTDIEEEGQLPNLNIENNDMDNTEGVNVNNSENDENQNENSENQNQNDENDNKKNKNPLNLKIKTGKNSNENPKIVHIL